MPFTVRLAHQSKSFIVEEDETILDAALRQNIDIPHSCCEGICGSCEGQVIDGYLHYQNTEHLALDDEERLAGRALFCSAKASSDLLIDVPGCVAPTIDLHDTYEYQLKSLEQISQDVYQAWLTPKEKPLRYLAGQYLEVHLPGQENKPFSIANAPNEHHQLELHIRCQADNAYAHQLIQHLQKHLSLMLKGPYGRCFYHPTPHMPALFLAVGTGFAPIKAILEQAFQNQHKHEMTLFWAGKSAHDLYQMSLVKTWASSIENFRLVPILASADHQADWPGVYGNMLDIVLDYFPRLEKHHLYFGGPIQLTLDALERFEAHGAQTCYMYSDVFDLV